MLICNTQEDLRFENRLEGKELNPYYNRVC